MTEPTPATAAGPTSTSSVGALPNFVVAGAPRCGTTSLHYYLQRHPDICMSTIKEPNYFMFGADGSTDVEEEAILRKSVRTETEYRKLFPNAGATAIGEVSPIYLYLRDTPHRIREVCGPVRIVNVLRDPTDRAWSHFAHAVRIEDPAEAAAEFERLVRAEMAIGTGYAPYRTRTHLLRLGRYHTQLERYREVFGAERMLTVLAEDLDADTAATLSTITTFLGVSDSHDLGADERANKSGVSRNGAAAQLRKAIGAVQPTLKRVLPPTAVGKLARVRDRLVNRSIDAMPPVPDELRAELVEWFRDDVEALASSLDRDLDSWLTVAR